MFGAGRSGETPDDSSSTITLTDICLRALDFYVVVKETLAARANLISGNQLVASVMDLADSDRRDSHSVAWEGTM